MGMPKPKPDNIIRHELVLGRSERELFDTFATAYTVNRIAMPITGLLASTTGLLLVSTLILSQLEKYLPPDWRDRDDNSLLDWFETQNLVVGGTGALLGGLLGLLGGPVAWFTVPAGAAVGGVAGGVYTEAAEDVWENPWDPSTGMALGPFRQIVAGARQLDLLIEQIQQ
jgi:hypothetical protein